MDGCKTPTRLDNQVEPSWNSIPGLDSYQKKKVFNNDLLSVEVPVQTGQVDCLLVWKVLVDRFVIMTLL